MSTRRYKRIRLALLALIGGALTFLLASETLLSRGTQPGKRADGVEIGVATVGTKAFVNRDSIAETGTRVTLWQRFALRSVKHTGAAEAVEQLVIYDCETRTVSTLESRELSSRGAVLRMQIFRPPMQDAIRAATLPGYIYMKQFADLGSGWRRWSEQDAATDGHHFGRTTSCRANPEQSPASGQLLGDDGRVARSAQSYRGSMKVIGLPIFSTTLFLAACGPAVDPASPEERSRTEAERSAALEAAEKEILNSGLPLPADPAPPENGAGGIDGTAVNRGF